MDAVLDNYGFVINHTRHVTPKEAWELSQQGILILDVREWYEIKYKKLPVDKLLVIPFLDFDDSMDLVPADQPVIVADAAGVRSKMVMEKLMARGYKNLANLAGGILEWERDGLPVTKDLCIELDGPCACMLNTWNKLKNK